MKVFSYLTYILLFSSSTFQAGIIFLHNAKGGNDYFKKHGKEHLVRCTDIYQSEPFLRTNRVAKILYYIVHNFDEPFVKGCGVEIPANVPNKRRDPRRLRQAYEQDNFVKNVYEDRSYDYTSPKYLLTNDNVMSIRQPEQEKDIYMTDKFKKDVQKLTKNFSSTRPEDIFMSSLTLSLGSNSSNESSPNNKPVHSAGAAFEYDPILIGQCNQNTPAHPLKHTQYPLSTSYINPQYQQDSAYHQIDSSNFCSSVPIWNLPSGVTWNAWESFIKSTI